MISLASYLVISTFLFLAGLVVMIARKNILGVLLGIELILNASALNFIAYGRFVHPNIDGQVFALFIIMIAAAEAAVGLAIVIRFFQLRESIHIDDACQLES